MLRFEYQMYLRGVDGTVFTVSVRSSKENK